MANSTHPPTHASPSSNSSLAAFVAAAIAAATLITLLHRKIAASRQRRPPGPAPWPLVGNAPQMLSNRPVFRWIDRVMADLGAEVVGLRLGPVEVIAVACPAVAREVLRKNDAAFADRPTTFAAAALSLGYLSASIAPFGEQWRKMRRVLTNELLGPAMEHRLHGKRAEEADHLVHYVSNLCSDQASGGAVDVRLVARHFGGNVIRRLVFGKRYFGEPVAAGGPGRDEAEHVDALFAALNYLDAFCISDYFPALVGLDLDGHERVVKGVVRTLRRLHDPIIEERVEQWRRLLREGGEKREIGDFLDVLISLEDAQGRPLLTVDEIKAQAIDLMIATVDNPSNAVEWALAEMVNNPEVMRKAMDEIDRVVGKERLVQESDIRQLNYLKACIREAFRIHPYHPFNPPRVAMADTTIAGYSVPKGSQVILSRTGLGRNPKVWDNPLEFLPERHLGDDTVDANVVLTKPDLRFISFSTGRRGCPGVSLGTSITMVLFARLLQGFTWSKPPGVAAVELQESPDSLTLAKPLVLQAKPRLPLHLYAPK